MFGDACRQQPAVVIAARSGAPVIGPLCLPSGGVSHTPAFWPFARLIHQRSRRPDLLDSRLMAVMRAATGPAACASATRPRHQPEASGRPCTEAKAASTALHRRRRLRPPALAASPSDSAGRPRSRLVARAAEQPPWRGVLPEGCQRGGAEVPLEGDASFSPRIAVPRDRGPLCEGHVGVVFYLRPAPCALPAAQTARMRTFSRIFASLQTARASARARVRPLNAAAGWRPGRKRGISHRTLHRAHPLGRHWPLAAHALSEAGQEACDSGAARHRAGRSARAHMRPRSARR